MKNMRLSAKTISFIDSFVGLLDNKFGPKSFKFGIDPLFSFLPGVGPFIPALFTLFLIALALHVRVPGGILLRMVGYLAVDLVVSLIPVLGLPMDAIFHANANSWKLVKPFVGHTTIKSNSKFPGEQIVIEGEIVK